MYWLEMGKALSVFCFQVNGIKWHQCVYCSKEFKKPSDLIRHIRIHTHEKPYKCNHCFQSFAVKSTLTSHERTHLGVKQFQCDVCSKHFSTQGSLKVHARLHSGEVISNGYGALASLQILYVAGCGSLSFCYHDSI